MKIELYIDKQLCDISDPSKFSVYLKRQFYNPTELNTKDAQASYSITLPATAVNSRIFGYGNVEEVRGKFDRLYDAQLIVNGIKIFDGKFKLSEIDSSHFKGNLGVPAPVTAKDIFKELNMNQVGEWKMDFFGAETVNKINQSPDITACIFPLALYGLLPRIDQKGSYSSKTLIDDTVRFDYKDTKPSINCLLLIKKMFENYGYKITGNAFNDRKLRNLYMSYKNPKDYANWWGSGKTEIHLEWSVMKNRDIENKFGFRTLECLDNNLGICSVNLFNATNMRLKEPLSDNQISTQIGNTVFVRIPFTGFYKITMKTKIKMLDEEGQKDKIYVRKNVISDFRTELKLIRNFDGKLADMNFDNIYFKNNTEYDYQFGSFFPQKGRVNFIDPYQNENMVNGFSFGVNKEGHISYTTNGQNPLNGDAVNPMAISGGRSWKGDEVPFRALSAVESPGYHKFDNSVGVPYGHMEVEVKNAPLPTIAKKIDNKNAEGTLSQIIWLGAGETLDLIDSSFLKDVNEANTEFKWYNHRLDVDLTIEAYKDSSNPQWLQVNELNCTEKQKPVNWDDEGDFVEKEIDLISFLPSNVKVDNWIENFCKAFNLSVNHTGGNNFELNIINKGLVRSSSRIIDLDNRATIRKSNNTPLGLPYVYELGFTVDAEEEGYIDSILDENGKKVFQNAKTGGGQYYTGSHETSKVSQTSNFSYCWYKDLEDMQKRIISVPVISEHGIWESKPSAQVDQKNEVYYDKPIRFWFKSGIYSVKFRNEALDMALVSNEYETSGDKLVLDYEDKSGSIMHNYFFLLDNTHHYTSVETYITPEEYILLDTSFVKLNGSLYNIIGVDKYDLRGKTPCEIKLIKKLP